MSSAARLGAMLVEGQWRTEVAPDTGPVRRMSGTIVESHGALVTVNQVSLIPRAWSIMTALRVHPSLAKDTPLYRYVSFETFVAFVETRRTHLRKITEWDDTWEAILSKIPTEDDAGMTLTPSYSFHQDTFGQAWSFLEESDAMWRIYSPAKNGLIISTQAHKFGLIEEAKKLYVGPIVYFKDQRDLVAKAVPTLGSFERLCFKRTAFDHEREVRLLTNAQFVPGCNPDAPTLTLPLDPVQFVDSIIIDPRAPSWFVETIISYCRRAGFPNVPVQSKLYAPDPHLTSGLVRRWDPVKDRKKQ